MRSFVSSKSTHNRQISTQRKRPLPVNSFTNNHTAHQENWIQRKPGCACGGGCPTCREEQATIQTKLKIGKPGDRYEQEADRVADQVMRMPETAAQRQPETEEEEEEERIQPKTNPGQAPAIPPQTASRIQALKGGGQPLPQSARQFFEPRFGRDFSRVRVHTDAKATETAQAVNARAYTLGSDIAFNKAQYNPGTTSGKQLLAHELTHVMQQVGARERERDHYRAGNPKPLRINAGPQRIMRTVWQPLQNPPGCSSHAVDVDREQRIEIGPITPGAQFSCVFSPLFHVPSGFGSVRVQAHSINPPAGDWRINVFECPWRSARGNECSQGRGDNAAAGSISGILRVNYNPILWVSRNLFIRFRNGSTSPIPNVQLTLRPQRSNLDSIGEFIHAALDALGLIPALGIVPDAANTGFYLIEGNWGGASISAAAMVPIFGQGAGLTRLGIRVSRESVERLGREGVEQALRRGVQRSGTRVLRRAPPERVINALRTFSSRTFRAGSETFQLDSRGMKHILERHHPRYWDGSVRQPQSFFDEHLSIDDIANAIRAVMSQKRQQLMQIGATRQGQIRGTWGGVTYVLGLNRGRVGQFYPL